MKKSLPGILLLAVAAFAGWTWWKRRTAPGSDGGATIAPNGDTSLLPQLQQVGSNVYQDVTGDLLTKLIASYERVAGGCWLWSATADNGNRYYVNSVTQKGQWFDAGILPTPLCGGSGAVGQNEVSRLSRGSSGNRTVVDADGCRRTYDASGREIAATC